MPRKIKLPPAETPHHKRDGFTLAEVLVAAGVAAAAFPIALALAGRSVKIVSDSQNALRTETVLCALVSSAVSEYTAEMELDTPRYYARPVPCYVRTDEPEEPDGLSTVFYSAGADENGSPLRTGRINLPPKSGNLRETAEEGVSGGNTAQEPAQESAGAL